MMLCKQMRNKTPYFLEANALSKIYVVLPVLLSRLQRSRAQSLLRSVVMEEK